MPITSLLLRRALGIAALAGFLASLAVHVEALRGVDVASAFPCVWLLHIGIFLVFGPFVLLGRKDFPNKPSWREMTREWPPGVAMLRDVIFIYAMVNFFLFFVQSNDGKPIIEGGKYLLIEHGKLIRELSPTEYSAFKANDLRGFSGHWMLFYFVPAAYFLFWKPPAQLASSASNDRPT